MVRTQSFNTCSRNLQLNAMLIDVVPISLVLFSVTVNMPPSVMLKLQLLSDGVRSEHSLADTGAGPSISTVTASMGGVYIAEDGVSYWMGRIISLSGQIWSNFLDRNSHN